MSSEVKDPPLIPQQFTTTSKLKVKSGKDENFDYKLDRIQKLGSLRDKGLLTDEEFNLQKSQILGE